MYFGILKQTIRGLFFKQIIQMEILNMFSLYWESFPAAECAILK